MRQDPKPKADHADRLKMITNELASTTAELTHLEQTLAVLKRTKLKNAYAAQFDAMRQLGEKMAMVSGYGDLLLDELKEPTPGVPYDGTDRTAWIRGAAAESLASYRGPLVPRPELGQFSTGLSPVTSTQALSPVTAASLSSRKETRDTR